MASSSTEIANLAISHLGVSKEIASLTENSTEATAINRFYETDRRIVLRAYPWPFASKFVALGLVATNPSEIDQEWTYSYRYPSDCLKFRRIVAGVVGGRETRQSRIPYKIGRDSTGLLIYTNQSNAEAEYTINETDVQRFPDDFVMALSLLLATHSVSRITGGDPFGIGKTVYALYLSSLGLATSDAFNEQQDQEDPESEFIRGRD